MQLIPFGPFRLVNAATIKEATFTPPIGATAETPAIKAKLIVSKADGHGEFLEGAAAEETWFALQGKEPPIGIPPRARRKSEAAAASPAQPPTE